MIGVRLTPLQRHALDEAARRENVTISELTRHALGDYLTRRTRELFAPAAGQGGEDHG